jgi:hypothetical protein
MFLPVESKRLNVAEMRRVLTVHFVQHLISWLTGTKKTTKIDAPQNRMNS